MNKPEFQSRAGVTLFWITLFTVFLTLNICSFKWADDYDFSFVLEPNLTENILQPIRNLSDIGESMHNYYFSWGGRFAVHSIVQFFSGIAGHGWFVIANTAIFLLMIFLAGKFLKTTSEPVTQKLILFSLLFWFVCPIPNETLLWISGSVNYLWASTAGIAAVVLFYRNVSNQVDKKFLPVLLLISLLCGTTHEIPSAALSAAFFLYLIFNRNQINPATITILLGFGIGTLLVGLAPGNFVRLALPGTNVSHFNISLLIESTARVLLELKAFWICLITGTIAFSSNRKVTIELIRKNAVLILAMCISLAMIILLKQGGRVTLFPELIATIMAVQFAGSRINLKPAIIILTILFIPDCIVAVQSSYSQKLKNEQLIRDCTANNGVVAFDRQPAPHRYAFPIEIPDFSENEFAKSIGVANLTIFPEVYKRLVPTDRFCSGSNGLFYTRQFRTVVLKIPVSDRSKITSVTLHCRYKKSLKRDLKKLVGKFAYDSDITILLESPDLIVGNFQYYLIEKPGEFGDEVVGGNVNR